MSASDEVTCDEARAYVDRLVWDTGRGPTEEWQKALLRFIDQAEALRQEHTALLMSHKVTVTERNLLRTRNAKLRAACELTLNEIREGGWDILKIRDRLREAPGVRK